MTPRTSGERRSGVQVGQVSDLPRRSLKKSVGQSLVEATLVLLVFFSLLFGVIDCGQVLYSHQALVERVREAVRWGSLHAFDGTGDQIANLVLYNRTEEPRSSTPGYLGLTRANVEVKYRPAPPDYPDDATISVAIVNFQSHFFSPWIARTVVNPRPVLVSAPIEYRTSIPPPVAQY